MYLYPIPFGTLGIPTSLWGLLADYALNSKHPGKVKSRHVSNRAELPFLFFLVTVLVFYTLRFFLFYFGPNCLMLSCRASRLSQRSFRILQVHRRNSTPHHHRGCAGSRVGGPRPRERAYGPAPSGGVGEVPLHVHRAGAAGPAR